MMKSQKVRHDVIEFSRGHRDGYDVVFKMGNGVMETKFPRRDSV